MAEMRWKETQTEDQLGHLMAVTRWREIRTDGRLGHPMAEVTDHQLGNYSETGLAMAQNLWRAGLMGSWRDAHLEKLKWMDDQTVLVKAQTRSMGKDLDSY